MRPEEETEKEQAGEQKWERWQKKRIFVREVSGKYDEIFQGLLNQPRVYKSKDIEWKGGPTKWNKHVINPQKTMVTQAIETHIDVLTPNSHGQLHGHMNSAVFYILEGNGYDVHDGVKHPWRAGDVSIVENMCVHRHYNADPQKPARYVIFKAKPTFIFFHLVFQRIVEYPSKVAPPGFEHFHPEP
jgi:quercetin dioxygenase-like cupin family protein